VSCYEVLQLAVNFLSPASHELLRLSSSPVGGPRQANGCSWVEMQLGQARAGIATRQRHVNR